MAGRMVALITVGVLLAAGPATAASFDCGKARTPFAKAICSNPELSKDDEAAAAAAKAALDGLSTAAAAEVQGAQDAWVKYANLACTKDARPATRPYNGDGIACLESVFSDRTEQLKNGATLGGLRFYYVDRFAAVKDPEPPDFGGTVGQKSVSTPRIDGDDDEASAFNHFIETGTGGDVDMSIATHPKTADGSEDDTQALVVTTVNPVRISMTDTSSFYGHGAAHPNYAVSFVHYLRGPQRRLVASDVFAGKDWQGKFRALALAAVKQTEGDDLMLDDPKSIDDIVVDPTRWDFSSDGLILQFEPYEIAAYAVGAPTVTIPWADLAGLLAPGAAELQK